MGKLQSMDKAVTDMLAFRAAQHSYENLMTEMQQYEAALWEGNWCSQVRRVGWRGPPCPFLTRVAGDVLILTAMVTSRAYHVEDHAYVGSRLYLFFLLQMEDLPQCT